MTDKPWIIVNALYAPFPANRGSAVRILEMVRFLRRDYRVGLYFHHPLAARHTLEDYFDSVWSGEECSSQYAPGERTRAKILARLVQQYRNNPLVRGYKAYALTMLDHLCGKLNPIAIISEYVFSVLPAVAVGRYHGILQIVDTHDIHYLRQQSENMFSTQGELSHREQELALLATNDVIIAIQNQERVELESALPEHMVITAEHPCVPVDGYVPKPSEMRVLFAGSDAKHNVDSVRLFLTQHWPEVVSVLPDAELHICGKVCEPISSVASAAKNVVLHGFCESLAQNYSQATVVINPIVYGSGLKIKTVEAIAHGKCLLSTPIGIQGLEKDVAGAVMVDEIENFPAKLIELLRDEEVRIRLEEGAQQAARRFVPEEVYAELAKVLRLASLADRSFSTSRAADHHECSPLKYIEAELCRCSVLIDTRAVPRKDYGRFYWQTHAKLNDAGVPLGDVKRTNSPPRLIALYAFFLDGVNDAVLRREGEQYFFHGPNYHLTANRYSASSCELFMLAEQAVEDIFQQTPLSEKDIFRKATMLATLFGEIHFTPNLNSVDDVRAALGKLELLVFSGSFTPILGLLHDMPKWPLRMQVDHLAFQFVKSGNYQACRDFIVEYFETRGKKYKVLDAAEIKPDPRKVALATAMRDTAASIESIGLGSTAFSQIASVRNYLNQRCDPQKLQSLTVFFPGSAPERYLMELLADRCTIVSLPHGMPQVSLTTVRPDWVLSLSRGEEWSQVFEGSLVAHAGWPEVLRLPAQSSAITRGEGKTVLFLSQIEGSRVHKIQDFVDIANGFLRSMLSIEPPLWMVDVRLRMASELEMLDADLVQQAKQRGDISFSIAGGCDMSRVCADLIVSSTSTGLMYAQYIGVPLLQIVSERLINHWPFLLAPEGSRLDLKDLDSELVPMIRRLLGEGDRPRLFDTLSAQERHAILDNIYDK